MQYDFQKYSKSLLNLYKIMPDLKHKRKPCSVFSQPIFEDIHYFIIPPNPQ